MSERRKLVMANWKMNHGIKDSFSFLAEWSKLSIPTELDVAICPPFTSLQSVGLGLSESNSTTALGAQNCHFETNGAFTGEVSLNFLKELECQYVIIGHSERRHIFNEPDEWLSKKVDAALQVELTPVFCVGETLEQREAGQTESTVLGQLAAIKDLSREQAAQVVIAYEPVWAIGTGKTATPDQAEEVHGLIRRWFGDTFGTAYAAELRILYGGSVKPENTSELMRQENIDGALVGGASLDAKSFFEIVQNSLK
ncbi:MAG: triose-phosphate isomerase [Deltaproteobacteria bacterium]|nr:triose-phosphate isomerase [Deltaproteobacteria bacterium]